jgi:hypothetical protein
VSYYSDLGAPIATKKNAKQWNRLLTQLDQLKTAPSSAVAEDQP